MSIKKGWVQNNASNKANLQLTDTNKEEHLLPENERNKKAQQSSEYNIHNDFPPHKHDKHTHAKSSTRRQTQNQNLSTLKTQTQQENTPTMNKDQIYEGPNTRRSTHTNSGKIHHDLSKTILNDDEKIEFGF